MSQLPYASVPVPPPAQRPTSVTVMAILGIIFGAAGLICTPVSMIPYVVTLPQPQGQANPVIAAIKGDSALFAWTMAASAMSWVLAIILLSGSMGALGLRAWARQFLIAWSFMGMLLAIAQTAVNAIFLLPKVREQLAAQGSSSAATGAALGGAIGTVVGLVLGVGFPLLMLFFMTRSHVKDAFERGLREAI